jgi:septal ring factor EnvC (AmiA/AmiB activator)
MPKILLSLSAVLIIVAATFSYLAKPKIEQTNADLASTKSTLATTKSNLAKTEGELKTTTADLGETKMKLETTTTERNGLKNELASTKSQLASTKDELDKANADMTALNAKLADITHGSGDIAAQFETIKTKLTEAETKNSELEQVNKTLTDKVADTEGKLTVMQDNEQKRKNRIMANGLCGQVLAVNRSYNFVVLSIGDKQGAVMNGEMVIKRGGTQVARVKITSVEPTTSIADVIPGSAARNAFVQPGDEVIYTGTGI